MEFLLQFSSTLGRLLRLLISTPILAFPRPSDPFVIDTDASECGIGAILSQCQDGVERVIAYGSCSLTKAERNYSTTQKELLALVYFLKHFRCYLLGSPFMVRTDHAALRWLQEFKHPEGQLARWLEQLQEFDFKTEHRPGRQHSNADALSRVLQPQAAAVCTSTACTWAPALSSKELQDTQANDPTISAILG